MKEEKIVVALEVAEAEFERFLDSMDIERDASRMDAEEKSSFEDIKRKFTRQVQLGKLVVDAQGQPVFTTSTGSTITFHEPTGASFMAMDSKKKGADFAKMCAVLADMTRVDASTYAKMPNRDFKVCQMLVTLFLA